MKHIVQFSGGKDSTALVLWAKENLPEFTAVFCDTGWEHPLTYEYIERINQAQLGGKLVTLVSEGMPHLVTRKRRVPSTHARFCTQELKVKPFMEWLSTIDDEREVYQGIRADESVSRRMMGQRVWSDDFDCYISRPLFEWTVDDVFDIHARHGLEPNPLYKLGAARVGCFPCIMVNKSELRRLSDTLPEVWERASNMESYAGRSFFKPDYIPARFHSGFDPKSGKSFPTVDDVRRYVTTLDDVQLRMFDRCSESGCLSVYNLCE